MDLCHDYMNFYDESVTRNL